MKCGETVVEMGSTQTEPAAAWNAAGAYAEGLRAERDALRADAERYRWLRTYEVDSYLASGRMDSLDAAIDAARGKA